LELMQLERCLLCAQQILLSTATGFVSLFSAVFNSPLLPRFLRPSTASTHGAWMVIDTSK
jgi:hypothetical protein